MNLILKPDGVLISPLNKSTITEDSKKIFQEILNRHPAPGKTTIGRIQKREEEKSRFKRLNQENQMMAIIGQLTVLPYDVDVARLAGKIARDGKNIIDLADAVIAATAIINEANLCTLNEKHFQSIPNLKLLPVR